MESGQIRRPSEAVLAALPDPVVVVEGAAVAWHNAAARELFGLPAAALDGREWLAVLGEEHEEALLDAQDRARGADEAVRLSLRRRDAAGADLSLDVAVIADGPRLVHVLRDATAAEAARAGLLAEKRRTDAILAAIDEVIYTDLYLPDGSVEFVHVGPGWERLLGNPPAGLTFDEAWDGAIHPDDDERCAEADDRLRRGEPIEFELRVACYDGVTRTILDRARPTRLSDGSVVVNGVLSDITGRKETEERLREALALAETALRETQSARAELERLSRVDVLTELANRRHFGDVLTFELERARREGESTGLLIVDLDHFKQINDSFGHLAGDEALRECARRISEGTRGYDTVARWGGEEFAVLLPHIRSDEELRAAAERVRAAVESQPLAVGGELLETTASVGAARTTSRLETADGLLEAADQALYAAKRRGRNRVRIASELTRRDLEEVQPLAVRLAEMLASSLAIREGVGIAHTRQVADLAGRIANALDLPRETVLRCRLGGLLHDVGKIAVPDTVLQKPGPLTAEEWTALRQHTTIGEGLVASVPELSGASSAVRNHHERWDGTGYPDGLAGEDIPLEARIVAAADAYSAMLGSRAYREGLSHGEALEELRAGAGSQLDPRVVDALAFALA